MIKIHEPLTIFLIGVTGDLAKKKILKAIYLLFEKELLPRPFTLVGNARKPLNRSEFQAFVKEVVRPKREDVWAAFEQRLYYVSGDAAEKSTFDRIRALHTSLEHEKQCGNHMWYVATLPVLYIDIVRNLKAFHLHQTQCGWTKILLEKPFGTDLASAQLLNQELTSAFSEEQIYRIDHYLGKETVQNVLAFRFANGLFEHLWSNEYIDHIQVTHGETLGVAGREQFYDSTGALRDVVQNHLLQMIAVTLMEEPVGLEAEHIRASRAKIINQISCLRNTDMNKYVRFGQYTAGEVYEKQVTGYQSEHPSLQHSPTETAAALKLTVDNERWRGVPIYLRTGKRFAQDVLEISIQFKNPEHPVYRDVELGPDPNILTFRFQPSEGIILKLFVKKPGHGNQLDEVPMSFCYRNQYQMDFVEAYERLIHDASMSDPTLFPSASSIEASWKIIDDILEYKKMSAPEGYKAGSWGPASFDQLIEQDGRKWIEPDLSVCKI